MPKTMTVAVFLATLTHPRKAEIEDLRHAILEVNKGITERIKWNAPSFCWNGNDRVTMRLQPGDRLQLIFHRGAKVKDATGFSFDDVSGLIEWAAKDRGVVMISDAADLVRKKPAILKLIATWMRATA
ncbi:MAG: DUF1801 domain-containing protein [Hyphomicrobium sp.]